MIRPLPGTIALAAISLLIGGAFAGLAVEAARDWSGAVSAFDTSMAVSYTHLDVYKRQR